MSGALAMHSSEETIIEFRFSGRLKTMWAIRSLIETSKHS